MFSSADKRSVVIVGGGGAGAKHRRPALHAPGSFPTHADTHQQEDRLEDRIFIPYDHLPSKGIGEVMVGNKHSAVAPLTAVLLVFIAEVLSIELSLHSNHLDESEDIWGFGQSDVNDSVAGDPAMEWHPDDIEMQESSLPTGSPEGQSGAHTPEGQTATEETSENPQHPSRTASPSPQSSTGLLTGPQAVINILSARPFALATLSCFRNFTTCISTYRNDNIIASCSGSDDPASTIRWEWYSRRNSQ
ncbi:hypothetical protein EW146_g8887 [Bondarzewia mesenterica]|uniref:Uncharacterized protein n=1 Tax=Bondarzewia mesenterica TaxID=1095465 RepID=A0A4V3XD86_9AGAM|nr:hypothetical protein EW146_g8887 [Bondarzewia mesenterica]